MSSGVISKDENGGLQGMNMFKSLPIYCWNSCQEIKYQCMLSSVGYETI